MGDHFGGSGLVLAAGGKLLLTDICHYSGTFWLDPASGETKLLDGIFWFMNPADDGIYASDQQRGHRLCRIDPRTGAVEPVSQAPCGGLIRQGDWLYYINEEDRKLYRLRMDGREESRIADEAVEAFAMDGDEIYYATGLGIRTCRADGSEREIVSDAAAAGLFLLGEKLVYADKKNRRLLTVFDLRTGSARAYDDLVPGSLCTDGRYLYCSNRMHADTIYRIDLELGSKIRFCGDSADHLHVIGGEMYFSSRFEWHKMSLSGGQAVKVITNSRGQYDE